MTREPALRVIPPRRRGARSGHSGTAQLLRRCRDGDDEAWAELVGNHERLVFGVAVREGLDTDDAADVTQIVFESLLTALPQLRDDERLSAWLCSVARRQAWRVRERRQRERSASSLIDDADRLPLPAPADDWSDEIERSLWLHDALLALGEPCRSLLIALYFDPMGPSYAEVAVRLGRPVGSIGPSRARCLTHLRAMMEVGESERSQGDRAETGGPSRGPAEPGTARSGRDGDRGPGSRDPRIRRLVPHLPHPDLTAAPGGFPAAPR
jgi:RNA polymerase sigma factor (sigma-70 family)